ncbi:MAG: type I methionyl aminopeptidase [Propionibacteriales bacterium]|nr:type I methionyl aminopeptidase [Propionibacteriales bacterium]
MGLRERRIEIKTPDQIHLMRRAGIVVAETLEMLRSAVAPGVTTLELDTIAEEHIRSRGAVPNFLGYHGFPASICTSVNDEVVHGIPGRRILQEGDLISLDCGAIVEGWHGDAAITVAVGEVGLEMLELVGVCQESLWRGLAAASLGGRVSDISHAIGSYVSSQGSYGVVEDYVGHGIGSAMHMPPSVPNYGRPGKGPKLVPGMALAVEPMITMGSIDTHVLDDDWTVATDDGTWAAHFEHSFTLTPEGTLVLTALDGGAAKLAELGIPCAA